MINSNAEEKNYWNVIWGIFLIITAINLGQTELYTSIKKITIAIGGSITLAISVAIGVIILTFSSGVFLLRRS